MPITGRVGHSLSQADGRGLVSAEPMTVPSGPAEPPPAPFGHTREP
jgi:hypothetical protein